MCPSVITSVPAVCATGNVDPFHHFATLIHVCEYLSLRSARLEDYLILESRRARATKGRTKGLSSLPMPFANVSQIDVFAQYNYTYQYANGSDYFNGTISNATQCYMLRVPYYPEIYPNGTLLNGTGCSNPINVSINFVVFLILLILGADRISRNQRNCLCRPLHASYPIRCGCPETTWKACIFGKEQDLSVWKEVGILLGANDDRVYFDFFLLLDRYRPGRHSRWFDRSI